MHAVVRECRPSGPRHLPRSAARPPQTRLLWSTTGQGVPQSSAGRQRFWAAGEAVVPGATTARWQDQDGREEKTRNALKTLRTLHPQLNQNGKVIEQKSNSFRLCSRE